MPDTSVRDLSALTVQASFSAPIQHGCTLLQVSTQISNLYWKMYVKAGGFLPYFFRGHKEEACMREEEEMGGSRAGGEVALVPACPEHGNGFVHSTVALHWRKGKTLGRNFSFTINWNFNNRRKC